MDKKQTHDETADESAEQLKVGQLYEWNGHELVAIPKSEQIKVPVTMEAMEAVRKIRARSTRDGFRPCLMVTASQMLLAATTEVGDLPDQVIDYGLKVYSKLSRGKGRS